MNIVGKQQKYEKFFRAHGFLLGYNSFTFNK